MAQSHVVLIPFPAQGHLNAFMGLCRWLAAQGLIVTVLNIVSIHDTMMQNWSPKAGQDIRLQAIPFHWNLPFGMDGTLKSTFMDFFRSLEQDLPKQLFDLLQNINPQITSIIYDYFLSSSTQPMANKLGVQSMMFLTGSAAWLSLEYHLPRLQLEYQAPDEHIHTDRHEELIDYVGGLAPFQQADLPWYLTIRNEEWLNMNLKRCQTLKAASCVLINSFYALESKTIDFLKEELGHNVVFAIGPVHLLEKVQTGMSLRSENEECLTWLDDQPTSSVLYISFGSLVTTPATNLEEIAIGLEANKQKFIWVIRSDLIVEGYEETYSSLCERLKELGMVVSWAPQAKVLAHPSVGGFLSHCGWNSALESICSGIPLLAWPGGAEQNFNAKLLVDDWKIGIRVVHKLDEVVEKGKVEKYIRKLMKEEEGNAMRVRARELQRLSKDALIDQQSNMQKMLNLYNH